MHTVELAPELHQDKADRSHQEALDHERDATGLFTVEIDFWEEICNHIDTYGVLQDHYVRVRQVQPITVGKSRLWARFLENESAKGEVTRFARATQPLRTPFHAALFISWGAERHGTWAWPGVDPDTGLGRTLESIPSRPRNRLPLEISPR